MSPDLCPKFGLRIPIILCVLFVALGLRDVHAADTMEVFEPGATDAEFYVGYDGLGITRGASTTFTEAVIGYGVAPQLSMFLSAGLEATGALTGGTQALTLGLYGTPLETEHVDLDLLLQAGGTTDGGYEVMPAVELNLDAADGLARWGVYLIAGVPVHAPQLHAAVVFPAHRGDVELDLLLRLGAYWTISPRHQVLLEVDGAVHALGSRLGSVGDLGGLALGYNVTLSETFELISQLRVDVPTGADQPWSAGLATGFIATL
jgi:hypothetical protein